MRHRPPLFRAAALSFLLLFTSADTFAAPAGVGAGLPTLVANYYSEAKHNYEQIRILVDRFDRALNAMSGTQTKARELHRVLDQAQIFIFSQGRELPGVTRAWIQDEVNQARKSVNIFSASVARRQLNTASVEIAKLRKQHTEAKAWLWWLGGLF